MKITYKKNVSSAIPFENVPIGTVLAWEDALYLATRFDEEGYLNAVNLKDYDLVRFSSIDVVTPVNAELIIHN